MTNVRDISELPFRMYDEDQGSKPEVYENIINSLRIQMTPLNREFFSRRNVDRIQSDLRRCIQKKLKITMSRQSDDQLLVIMRGLYMQHADPSPDSVRDELIRLNAIVVAECAPMVASGIKQRLAYLEDASRLPPPLERAQNTSVKGTRTLELDRSI